MAKFKIKIGAASAPMLRKPGDFCTVEGMPKFRCYSTRILNSKDLWKAQHDLQAWNNRKNVFASFSVFRIIEETETSIHLTGIARWGNKEAYEMMLFK